MGFRYPDRLLKSERRLTGALLSDLARQLTAAMAEEFAFGKRSERPQHSVSCRCSARQVKARFGSWAALRYGKWAASGRCRPQADRCETSPKTVIAAGGLGENDNRLIRRQNHG